MVSETEIQTCTVCYHAKALLSQAVLVDSSIISFNCGHGVTEILDDQKKEHPKKPLKPISINTITNELMRNSKNEKNEEENEDLACLLCEEKFSVVKDGVNSPLLAHLLAQHKIVIAEVDKIADFNRYITYWRGKFTKVKDITEYCVVINPNAPAEHSGDANELLAEKHFLLTDFLPEDEDLRRKLNIEQLSKILDEQQVERTDEEFSRCCLFCKEEFSGNRAALFKHMAVEHSFNVGNSDNIVHAAEFIDLMRLKLDRFACLFCENSFKDWNILKDHMRKKQHKRINPKNKLYDRFYLINYLDRGKYWKELQKEPEYEREDPWEVIEEHICNERVWQDWTEAGTMVSLCLFCSKTDEDVNNIISHMVMEHDFDLHTIKVKLGLNFYHQVKIVNYIRKQVYQNKCPCCAEEFTVKDSLNEHFFTEKHCKLPEDRSVWDQPGYFFPTFDDDSLLCFLEDDGEEDEENRKVDLLELLKSVVTASSS